MRRVIHENVSMNVLSIENPNGQKLKILEFSGHVEEGELPDEIHQVPLPEEHAKKLAAALDGRGVVVAQPGDIPPTPPPKPA